MTAAGKLIIVGADKGGVGKTLVSRLLCDWVAGRISPFQVYDTEANMDGKTTLRRFRNGALVADVSKVAGQMSIFDGLLQSGLTLVDMRAGQLSETLRTMRNAGLLDKADEGHVHLTVMHVLGSSTQSMSEIADVSALLGGDSQHVLIENQANDGQFFKWDENTRGAMLKSVSPAARIEVPHLDSQAGEDVDRKGLSFADYMIAPDASDYLRRTVRFWIKTTFQRFDDASLTKIVGL